MCKRAFIAILLLIHAGGLFAQNRQTLPAGFDTRRATGASTTPLGPSPTFDQKWQFHYANSNFAQLSPIRITAISFRVFNPASTLNAFNFNNITVTMADATTGYQVGQHDPIFANNLGANATVVYSGAWSGPGAAGSASAVVSPWITLTLQTPFDFDPSLGRDFIVQWERCGGGTLWNQSAEHVLGAPGTALGNRYGITTSCSAIASNQQGNEQVPLIAIDFVPVGLPDFELNDAESAATIDGALATPFNPAVSLRCVGDPTAARFASSGVGLPFDVGFALAPVLRRSAGAITSAGGQVVHLNPTAPLGILFLFGGAFPNFTTTAFPGPFAVPFSLLPVPGDLTVQMLNAAPANPEGFALSQGASLNFVQSLLTATGPNTDDAAISFRFGAPPLCGPNDFPFYGTTYTEFHVSSNGRVTFNLPDPAFGPASAASVLTTQPFFGVWTDFDPGVGGTIILNNTGGLLQIAWSMVPNFGTGGSNTFTLEMDPATRSLSLLGLLGVGTGGQSSSAIGISPGALGGATDPGPVDYTTLSGATTNGTDAIYRFGPPGTLASGLNTIIFTPNASMNYDWVAF